MKLPLLRYKKLISPLVLPFLFNILFSCTPAAYLTQTPVVPLFKEKGDAYMELGFNISGNRQTSDIAAGVKLAYALTDHIVIAGSIFGNSGTVDTTQNNNSSLFSSIENWGIEHDIFNISAGWYNSGKGDIDSNWRVEVLGGISYASLQNLRKDGWVFNSKSLIYSVKPAVGYVSKNFTFYTSLKINYLDYLQNETRLPSLFALRNQFFNNYDGHFIIEPSLGVQVGIKQVKWGLHYAFGSFNKNISIERLSDTPIVSNRMISLVMIFRPRLKRQK